MSSISVLYAIVPRLTRTMRVPTFNTFSSISPAVFFSSKYEKEYKHYLEEQSNSEIKKTKKPAIPKITLIASDQGSDKVTITTLPEAQKLSKRRDLKLVKVLDVDTKTQRPVYKLMSGAEYHAEDLKLREMKKIEKLADNSLKGEKVLIVGDNISEHDIITQTNKIRKWIQKRYEVRIVINGNSSNMDKAEKVYSLLESTLQSDVRFLQKRTKGSDIKFQVVPPKKDNENEKEKASEAS